LREVEQYKRNLSELYLWMDNSEAGMEQANNAIQRIRELVVQGKNGTYSDEDKKAIAREIEQLKDDLVTVANTKVAGRYIFNGTDVGTQPVTPGNPPIVAHNTDDYLVEISRGIKLKGNVNPANVFSQDLFNTVNEIQKNFDGDPLAVDLDTLLGNLDSVFDKFSAERSELGARYNRLEMVQARINLQEVVSNRILSDNEDADLERVITDLTVQESVHRAALGVGARIIQPSLLDFLR
jgi:flagellar hook-associated protein 3 FlgL